LQLRAVASFGAEPDTTGAVNGEAIPLARTTRPLRVWPTAADSLLLMSNVMAVGLEIIALASELQSKDWPATSMRLIWACAAPCGTTFKYSVGLPSEPTYTVASVIVIPVC